MRGGVGSAIAALLAFACASACGLGIVGVDPASDVDGTDPTSADAAAPGAPSQPSLDDGGELPLDATTLKEASADVSLDAVTVDALPDAPAACPPGSYHCAANDLCVTNCAACQGSPIGCSEGARRCVASCTSCAQRPFECYACAVGGFVELPARCEREAKYCYVPGVAHCKDCKKDGCRGPEQTCIKLGGNQYECRGCGEPATNGSSCAGGGTCNAGTQQCP
jgi:hypothetical protein